MPKNDFIPRKAIYDAVNAIGGCDATEEWAKGYDSAIDAVIMDIIEGLPAADVVEVVRCKDCKYYPFCFRTIRTGGNRPDDFCSFGERK